MILSGQVSSQDQTITALRRQFFDAMQQFAPHTWQNLCGMKDAYKLFFGDSIWTTWDAYSTILKPANGIDPHWRDSSWLLSNPVEIQLCLLQYELFKDLQEWREKYSIQDTWVMNLALEWLSHISQHTDRDTDKASLVVGLKFFEVLIDPKPPKLPAYELNWVSRKKYLTEATALLERYCDDIETEALSEQMEFTKNQHPRAHEWLIQHHFNGESFGNIAGGEEESKEESTVRRAVQKLAKKLEFTCREPLPRGRPRKTI